MQERTGTTAKRRLDVRQRALAVGLAPHLRREFPQGHDGIPFKDVLGSSRDGIGQRIITIGASHHRLAWVHPFHDGNGRDVRLFSDAAIRQLGIDRGGLWSLSRGFARTRTEYYARLSNEDQERSSSSADDGRGHLSERALWDFCEFTLRVMADQIAFMEQLLDLDGLERRIEHYVRVVDAQVSPEADRVFLLLREALLRGEFPRGEAARIVGASERTGRSVLTLAVDAGLLVSDTPKAPVRLGLPANVHETYFPQLFPANQVTASVGYPATFQSHPE